MKNSNRPLGFFSPALAACTGRWAERPFFDSDHMLRAAGRVIRRRNLPINLLRVSYQARFSRSDRRPCLTWHHAANHALLLASSCRRNGSFALARMHLSQARSFTVLARGWCVA